MPIARIPLAVHAVISQTRLLRHQMGCIGILKKQTAFPTECTQRARFCSLRLVQRSTFRVPASQLRPSWTRLAGARSGRTKAGAKGTSRPSASSSGGCMMPPRPRRVGSWRACNLDHRPEYRAGPGHLLCVLPATRPSILTRTARVVGWLRVLLVVHHGVAVDCLGRSHVLRR